MSELRDKVISIHQGILVALGQVGFGEVPGYGFCTMSYRECVCTLPTISLESVSILGCSLVSRSNPSFSMIGSLKLCVWGLSGSIAKAEAWL